MTVADGTYRFVPRPAEAVICGDFNFVVDDSAYARMTAPFGDNRLRTEL